MLIVTLPGGAQVQVTASTTFDIDLTGIAPDTKVTVGAYAIGTAGAGGGTTATLRSGA